LYQLFKPLLFRIAPETAHHLTFWLLDRAVAFAPTRWLLEYWYCSRRNDAHYNCMGLMFPNRVGLAAGFDKDGRHLEGLKALGFGFIEVGTVTPVPQSGNPKPRLFRLPADHALINRMGFNNLGLDALVKELRAWRARYPAGVGPVIGGNIGKNKSTPNEQAHEDYVRCFEALFDWVDYFVVNVSSPNTPDLRALQDRKPLTQLLTILQEKNKGKSSPKPILLKIAPDLNEHQLSDIVSIVQDTKIAGIIASNTTIQRDDLNTSLATITEIGAGGLSGAPLRERSTAIISTLRTQLGPDVVIIGVGGIDSPAAAQEKLAAGANLIQVYSGLIYEGPGLIRNIVERTND
jgi:dihydroorotate dehydrogenase